MIIVIDGPAGSGKSTTAKAVAQKMALAYLDSGALYRALTWLYVQADQDKKAFFKKLDDASVSFTCAQEVFQVAVDGHDVTDQLRRDNISRQVSEVASQPRVRSFVNDLMREAVKSGQYIAEGRDLGTAVFPEAALKFYMVADAETRARRRLEQLTSSGEDDITFEEVLENIQSRDEKDANREADPLKKAPDAIEIDSSGLAFDEQVRSMCSIISDKTELTYKP